MRYIATTMVILGCAHPAIQTRAPERSMYIVTLGNDTTYIEWLTINGRSLDMQVVERIPRVRSIRLSAMLHDDGTIASLDRVAYLPNAADTSPVERVSVREIGDSTIFETTTRTTTSRYATYGRSPLVVGVYNGFALPVIARFAPARPGDSIVSTHIGGFYGDRPIVIKRISADSIEITGPHLGRAAVHARNVDSNGFTSIGTINFIGARAKPLPFDSVLRSFADAERARGIMGSASPWDTARATIDGATLMVDYGRPSKRGRKIFGGIVPWNEIWRAGANEATQFSTDRALRFGSSELPAGKYSLWIFPTPSEWTLIINKETDQWGTDYNQSFDLLRVPLARRDLDGVIEKFTIRMDREGSTGNIRFLWDNVQLSAPFTVVP
jgi:hypothetical protein